MGLITVLHFDNYLRAILEFAVKVIDECTVILRLTLVFLIYEFYRDNRFITSNSQRIKKRDDEFPISIATEEVFESEVSKRIYVGRVLRVCLLLNDFSTKGDFGGIFQS